MKLEDKAFMYRTDRLGLKRLDFKELNGSYPHWFSDESVNQYNSHFGMPETPEHVRRYVEGLVDDRSKLVFAIYWLVDQTVHVGNIAVQNIDLRNRSAELAFLFGEKDYWGQGVAFEASVQVIEHCRDHLNLRRLYLGCFEDNQAMCKLASKLGFAREGCLKDAVFGNGKFNDVLLYGLLF